MALHPIKALDHVIDEYADYLGTEFRAKDPKLREALERELDAPGFLPRSRSTRPTGRSRAASAGETWRSNPSLPR